MYKNGDIQKEASQFNKKQFLFSSLTFWKHQQKNFAITEKGFIMQPIFLDQIHQ